MSSLILDLGKYLYGGDNNTQIDRFYGRCLKRDRTTIFNILTFVKWHNYCDELADKLSNYSLVKNAIENVMLVKQRK